MSLQNLRVINLNDLQLVNLLTISETKGGQFVYSNAGNDKVTTTTNSMGGKIITETGPGGNS